MILYETFNRNTHTAKTAINQKKGSKWRTVSSIQV